MKNSKKRRSTINNRIVIVPTSTEWKRVLKVGGVCWAVTLFDSALCAALCAVSPSELLQCHAKWHRVLLDMFLVFLRNWYVDEPSCGSEICVVMYHQPSAPPGVGGPYMFQWNDDRCNMKNNFICKYSFGNETFCSLRKQPAPRPQEEIWGDCSNR